MKSIKRILALLMALAIVLCLGACGGGDKDDTSSGDAVDYLETASEKQVALFGDLKGTKLRVADDVDMMEWEENFYKQLEEETGMKVEIEPMSSNERRIIHSTLQNHPSVDTYSIGEEPYRKVVIALKKK